MKNTIVVGVVMLGLGFAIGWVAKPVPFQPTASVAAAKTAAAAGNAGISPAEKESGEALQTKRAEREPAAPKPPGQPSDEQMAQAKKMQSEMSKAMVKRIRGKFEQQIEKLAESLHLTATQKSALTASFEEKMKKLEALDFSDPKAMSGMTDALKGLTNKALEDELAPGLSEEQKTAMADFKEKELRGKVDTMALKGISKMQGVIDFQEGQRDEVYKILSASAEATAMAEEEEPDVAKLLTDGMGIELDPYDLGLQKVMSDSMGMDGGKLNSATPEGKKEMARNLRESIDQRVEQKVELLRPVLNEKQLGQYRDELKTKGLGVYGPMLNALDPTGGAQ
jgi:hypothetical protein